MSSSRPPPRRSATPPPRAAERPRAEALSKAPARLREIRRTPHFVLRYDIARRLVVATRSSTPFESLSALRVTFEKIEEALDGIPNGALSLFVDSRRSPARNDPAFEEVFAQLRRRLLSRFKLKAIYMQTAVGVLQSSRHSQMDKTDVFISVDLRAISEHLGVFIEPEELELDGPP